MSQYMIVIEQKGDAWGAYAPDLPGLGVAGSCQAEVELLAEEAVIEHLHLLKELGETVLSHQRRSSLCQSLELATIVQIPQNPSKSGTIRELRNC